MPASIIVPAEPLRIFWHVRGPTGQYFACTLRRVVTGFEVRVESRGQVVLRRRVRFEVEGANLAAAWKRVALRWSYADIGCPRSDKRAPRRVRIGVVRVFP